MGLNLLNSQVHYQATEHVNFLEKHGIYDISLLALLALLSEYWISKCKCKIICWNLLGYKSNLPNFKLKRKYLEGVVICFDCFPDSSLNRNDCVLKLLLHLGTLKSSITNFNWIFSIQVNCFEPSFGNYAFNSIQGIIVSTNLKLKILSWLSYLK